MMSLAALEQISTQNRSLTYSGAPTYQEFTRQQGSQRVLLLQRLSEIRLHHDAQPFFTQYPDTLNFAALVTEGDPDMYAVLPIWERVVQCNRRFDLRIFSDDDGVATFRRLLGDTDLGDDLENFDLPLIVAFDEEWQYQFHWGPRPQSADSYLDEWLANHPTYEALAESDNPQDHATVEALTSELAYEMRVWYNSGLAHDCIAEIQALLAALQDSDEDANEVGDEV